MEQKHGFPLNDLRHEISKSSSAITQDTRAWLWFRTYVLNDPTLRRSLQADSCAHAGAAGLVRWCADHGLYPSATFSRRDRKHPSQHAQRRRVHAFAAKVLSFAAVICAPDAAFEVKETGPSGLGLFARRELEVEPGEPLPGGLMGWRRSLGDAQPTASLNSWMSNSTASKSSDALIGPLSLGNHRCESDLEWAQTRGGGSEHNKGGKGSGKGSSNSKKKSHSCVVLRAKAGKTVRIAVGAEIRWNYGQIDFECKCPDEHVHLSRKRKRLDSDLDAGLPDEGVPSAGDVGVPAAKRPRTRSQAAAVVPLHAVLSQL
jgi:hypothetical protein